MGLRPAWSTHEAAAEEIEARTAKHLTFHSILKFFQVDIIGMFRMTSSARYRKDGVGSSRPNWR